MVSMRALICAKLLLEVGQALGRRARQLRRRGDGATAVEHALARLDLGQRLVDRRCPGAIEAGGRRACGRSASGAGVLPIAPRRSTLLIEPREDVGDRARVVAASPDGGRARVTPLAWLR